MNYEMIVNYASLILAIVMGLVFVVNIIVEVIKNLFARIPTNVLAFTVAQLVCWLAMAAALSLWEVAFVWYHIPAAVIMGIFVAYAAMFGFDKFKEAFEKLKSYNE